MLDVIITILVVFGVVFGIANIFNMLMDAAEEGD